ncbi:hypothetical protein Tco_1365843 [Tanacetum coccineum]
MGIQNGGEKDLDLIERVVVTKKVHLPDKEDAEEVVFPLELIASKQEALDLTSRTVMGAGERRDGGLFYFRDVPTT